ncbi:hypothetical protein IQ258_29065 [Coleofasciculus sp. LEGE 07081]|uniref:hypothetical protein n=1 Tax=Coleofasciculus sp. LEGE 07081 TaxID=2777967 RepID=UPI001A102CED|nr:hypothetical protein [Coleofasciculus sp. LEGE 07081]MBE9130074.1 hypothetical protein [Coleofasciculus sp. LEGE 07081]
MLTQDEADLDRLALFNRVAGYIFCVMSLCGFPHFLIGLFAVFAAPGSENADAMPAFVGALFMAIGFFIIAGSLVLGIMCFKVEERLKKREGFNFCQVIAAVGLLFGPVGLALGIYSLITYNRLSVRQLFSS